MRDKVLSNAALKENEVLLDVGCGDDFIAFTEQAGLREIHLELQVNIQPHAESRDVETMLRSAPNPKMQRIKKSSTKH